MEYAVNGMMEGEGRQLPINRSLTSGKSSPPTLAKIPPKTISLEKGREPSRGGQIPMRYATVIGERPRASDNESAGGVMHNWQEDLLGITECAQDEHQIFQEIERATQSLGFEFCSYGMRIPVPLSKPKTILLSNYPEKWKQRYISQNYVDIDPTVLHGRCSQAPLLWSNKVFRSQPAFWSEARSHGIRFGWTQSCLDAVGVGGMLSLSRSHNVLKAQELADKERKMRWLVNVSHLALSRIFNARHVNTLEQKLTRREIEVLRWTADGKTSGEVSDILVVSVDTVNFHVKNAVNKLQTANKTAAAVRAAMLGLLN